MLSRPCAASPRLRLERELLALEPAPDDEEGFGHTFVTLERSFASYSVRETWGFWPYRWEPHFIVKESGPGVVWDDSCHRKDITVGYSITQEAYESVRRIIARERENPSDWHLRQWNCTNWAIMVAKLAGVENSDDMPSGSYTSPSDLADWLRDEPVFVRTHNDPPSEDGSS